MSTKTTKLKRAKTVKLTEHQRYILGLSVAAAFERAGWNGNLRSSKRPRLLHGTITTIRALIRAQCAEDWPTPGSDPRLTKLGIEVGEVSCEERLGKNPKQIAAEKKAAEKHAEQEARIRVRTVALLFRGIEIEHGGKSVGFRKMIEQAFDRATYTTFPRLNLDQLDELGKQIEKLRS